MMTARKKKAKRPTVAEAAKRVGVSEKEIRRRRANAARNRRKGLF